MNVLDLDGNLTLLKLVGHSIGIQNRQSRSQYHLQARDLIKQAYPTLQLLEEVSIQIHHGQTLYLDFFLPLIKKCIEVHGEQHYKFTSFFHTSIWDFINQQKRDNDKAEWCKINNIDLVVLKYDEIDKWKEQI